MGSKSLVVGSLLAAVLSCPVLSCPGVTVGVGLQGCQSGVVPAPPAGSQLLGSWLPAFSHPLNHPCSNGSPPGFNAIHTCLIPSDPTRPSNPNGGKVLVWDDSGSLPVCAVNANGDYVQRYAIVDPIAQTFQLGQFMIPESEAPLARVPGPNPGFPRGFQGLFCSGHCWLRDGKLLVAGGDDWSENANLYYSGSKLVCLFDPWAAGNTNHWSVLRETASPNPLMHLRQRRWYPSVLRLADNADTVIIAGGVDRWEHATNWYVNTPHDYGPETYEAIRTWDPNLLPPSQTFSWDGRPGITINGQTQAGLFSGPALAGGNSLFYYPRLHLTSQLSLNSASTHGLAWSVAFPTESAWIDHVITPAMSPAAWAVPATLPTGHLFLEEPSTLLMPNLAPFLKDFIVTIGGQNGWGHMSQSITNAVWLLDTKAAAPAWTVGPAMYYPRKFHKTVILPDLSLLTVGGGQESNHAGAPGCEDFWPEVYLNGQWRFCAKEESGGVGSRRTYHSCAVLLPSGEVLSCGGNTRNFDYQVFRPHYFDGNPVRPRWDTSPALPTSITYGQSFGFSFQVPALQSIEKVVLISPGSWTHAQDPGQRAVSLSFSAHKSAGSAIAPLSQSDAPPGLYMIWLVSSAGIPSVAQWVKLE